MQSLLYSTRLCLVRTKDIGITLSYHLHGLERHLKLGSPERLIDLKLIGSRFI
jgi:hypothetical protein